MNNRIFPGMLGMLACLPLTGAAQEPPRRPNVVIFLTDDQGSVDLNCYGSHDLATPNMDRICNTGVRFTQFYAASSISSPSRAALLTGRYPQRAGVPALVAPDPQKPGLPASEVTLAEMLRDNGYRTALIGKWHLGHAVESQPNAQGFDYFFGHLGGCIDNYSHYFYWNGPNRHDLHRNGEEVWYAGRNFSELMVEESLRFIEENRERPFLLCFMSNYPHYPLQGDDSWREYYAAQGTPHPRDKYAAMVSTVDQRIGAVLDKLDEEGLADDTIVIFMSDNGHSTEERTFGGGGSAGIFRGNKFTLYEGGIRVPAAIRYPRVFTPGTVCDRVASGCDWLPTIAELCGATLPDRKIDGRSLVETVNGDGTPQHPVLHWATGKIWAVRKGDYKLVCTANGKEAPTIELFHIVNDPSESKNLAAELPDKVEELRAEHDAWVEEVKQD